MGKVILGIDTSNYTTSLSLMAESGELVANIKCPLPVAEGERGLRQSDAVFAHVKNIPAVMKEMRNFICNNEICAVGVSSRPRNIEGSYMPCFLSGVALAEGIATSMSVPIYRFSHQCGHVMAAVYSSANFSILSKPFGAFHVSGGTTELLRIEGFSKHGFDVKLVGGTKDLNAGQIIDRIGVYMGLKFPAGPAMEELALSFRGKIPRKKPSVSGMEVNFSGLENLAKKLYDESGDKSLTSAFVFDYISRAITLMCMGYEEKYGKSEFIFAGGVMSNSIIKRNLGQNFNSSFAIPAMSADNAVGIAYLTLNAHLM